MTYLRKKQQQNLITSFVANTATQRISEIDETVTPNDIFHVLNTEVSFTPPQGNFQYVVYEYTIQYSNNPDNSSEIFYELREKIGSGAYSQLGDGYRATERAIGHTRYNSTLTGRFIIPIYTGTRSYKLTMRSDDNGDELTLNTVKLTGSATSIYSPIIQMYCI